MSFRVSVFASGLLRLFFVLLQQSNRRQENYYSNIYNMAFRPASRDWSMRKVPTKAQVTYTAGMFVYNDGTNNVPVASTTQGNVVGIATEAKASSATTTDIHVLVPNSLNSTFYADGGSGTLTKASEGLQFDFADGGLTIAQAASTYDTVQLVKYNTASTGVFRLNHTYGVEN